MTGMSLSPGMRQTGKPSMLTGEPTSTLSSRLLSPRPKSVNPMPLMPCSACIVTLMSAMSSPINAPTTSAASTPSHGSPPR